MNDRFKSWLKIVDCWRGKFTHPLTRLQVAEILLDDRCFDKTTKKFTKPGLTDLAWVDWEDYANMLKDQEV